MLLDTFDEAGANRIAEKIKAFWAKRGVSPRVWVEKLEIRRDYSHRSDVWCVRSTIADMPEFASAKIRIVKSPYRQTRSLPFAA